MKTTSKLMIFSAILQSTAATAEVIDINKYFAYVIASSNGTSIFLSDQKCTASNLISDTPDAVKKALFIYPQSKQYGCWIERKDAEERYVKICPMEARDSSNEEGKLDYMTAVCVDVPIRQFIDTASLPRQADF